MSTTVSTVSTENAVIFDFNGVVVDDEPQHARAFAAVLREEGIELTEEDYFGRYLGLDDRGLFQHVLADHGRPPPAADAIAARVERKAEAYLHEIKSGFELCAGANTLIRSAAERYPLAVGSGARRHEIELILERAGLRACFETIVSADDVSAGKPDPETYVLAYQRLRERHARLRPASCLVIEDAPNGLKAARAAGMQTIAVCGSRTRDELGEADRVVASLTDLAASTLFPG